VKEELNWDTIDRCELERNWQIWNRLSRFIQADGPTTPVAEQLRDLLLREAHAPSILHESSVSFDFVFGQLVLLSAWTIATTPKDRKRGKCAICLALRAFLVHNSTLCTEFMLNAAFNQAFARLPIFPCDR